MVRWWVLGIQWTVRWWVLGIQWMVQLVGAGSFADCLNFKRL
jgi:hypothetical protein